MALLAPVETLAATVTVVAEDDARLAVRVNGGGPVHETEVDDIGGGGIGNDWRWCRGRKGREHQGQSREDVLHGEHLEGLLER